MHPRIPARLRAALWLAALVLIMAAPAAADVFHLKSGDIIEGKILTDLGDAYVVKIPYGTTTIQKKDVLKIERKIFIDPEDEKEPEKKPEKTPEKEPEGKKPSGEKPGPEGEKPSGEEAKPSEEEARPSTEEVKPLDPAVKAEAEKWIQALREAENRDKREEAATALHKLGKEIVPLIAAEIQGEEGDLTFWLVMILGNIGDPAGFEAAHAKLESERADVRQAAAMSLGKMKDRRAVPGLIKALQDKDNVVRRRASRALGQIGDSQAVIPLIRLLGDEDWWVRLMAKRIVLQLVRTNPPPVVVEALEKLLESGDERQKKVATELLAKMGAVKSSGGVRSLVNDKSPDVRANAAIALGKMGGPEAFRDLMKLLRDPVAKVRSMAALGLQTLGDAKAIPRLIERLRDRELTVKNAAHRALASLSGESIPANYLKWRTWWSEKGKKKFPAAVEKERGPGVPLPPR
jgi:HEAT repeat protein